MKFHESETIELKEIYTSGIRKEIVAFANTKIGSKIGEKTPFFDPLK